MGASLPALGLANRISLPARLFAVVDPGETRTRILVTSITRGRPRCLESIVVDTRTEGFATPEEMREDVRRRLREIAPEAVILVLPQHRFLRHVLDIPPGDAAQTRAWVEREASNIGGLSESSWAFDYARLRPFAHLPHPVAAAFCRHGDLDDLLGAYVEDENLLFDVRPAGDSLAVAFRQAAPDIRDAILIDPGPEHTGLLLLVDGQPIFSTSFPSGDAALNRAEPSSPSASDLPREVPAKGSLADWRTDLERTLREWSEDHPDLAVAATRWPAFIAAGPMISEALASLNQPSATRRFLPWPTASGPNPGPPPEASTAWGAYLLALGTGDPAPSFLPQARRDHWTQQRFWRWLLSADLLLAVLLGVVLALAISHHRRVLSARADWRAQATRALEDARDIRVVAGGFNERMDALRPVLERQRQTVETLQVFTALQRQRTNDGHWYVLLADVASYAAGSNHFPSQPPRPPEIRHATPGLAPTNNPPAPDRAFIAEVCLVPQGEKMRQSLSDLVADLKRSTLFRNVDVVPAERRRPWVATNLIFPERHFALELNLSEAELLPPLVLPRTTVTNREPRNPFRSAIRPASESAPPGGSSGNSNGLPGRGGRTR